MGVTAPSTPAAAGRLEQAWAVLDGVPDPEVPAVSVRDLGIVRDVRLADDGVTEVVLTPTYSGCPATEAIERAVVEALEGAGFAPVRAVTQRSPAWTTDWITEEGRRKLREYGIAPPGRVDAGEGAPVRFFAGGTALPSCPRCASPRTERLSAFGSTACKALYRCLSCREPFEHFKPI
jgi:ring-1,2-phenylacetyl-CoA epoxidase subunit PaaD